jgi:hypothetical protein
VLQRSSVVFYDAERQRSRLWISENKDVESKERSPKVKKLKRKGRNKESRAPQFTFTISLF